MIRCLAISAAGLLALFTMGPANAADVLARYSIVAHDPINDKTVLLARAVVDGDDAACPALSIDGAQTDMSVRLNPDAARFPVTVCEAVAPLGSAVMLAGNDLPTVAGYDAGDLRVTVFGDSGCKGSPRQDCATQWPFAGIAEHAAATTPDLVIQVGDLDYLGTPRTDAQGDTSYDGCIQPDGAVTSLAHLSDWSTWRDDVFTPAKPLFDAAPWVVARGNHALCSRGGQGWFYLFDPHSTLLDPYHAAPRCDAPIVTTDPYPLRVGELSMIVIDNSNGCDNKDWQGQAGWDYQTRLFAPVIDRVAQLARELPGPVWVVTHRPFWAAVRFEDDGELFGGSLAWQLALRASLGGALPDNVALVVSGHVHDFEALVFDGARPPQLIAGMGGVSLDKNYISRPVDVEVDGLSATGWITATPDAQHSFGYLDITLQDAANWRGRLQAFQPDGQTAGVDLVTCAMPVRDGVLCSPP